MIYDHDVTFQDTVTVIPLPRCRPFELEISAEWQTLISVVQVYSMRDELQRRQQHAESAFEMYPPKNAALAGFISTSRPFRAT